MKIVKQLEEKHMHIVELEFMRQNAVNNMNKSERIFQMKNMYRNRKIKI